MLYHKLLSLNDACRQSLAQAMYGRLVFESEDNDSYQLLEDFIVNTELPQSIKLSILSSFILALDRGHACMSDKDCQASCKTRFLGETNHTSECQFFKTESSMHERRFRAMALTRQCVQVVMATWNKSIFSPAVLVENSFPVGLSLRMRQWLVTYAVDGFLMCHNICQSSFPTSKAEPDDASSFWQKAELYHLSASVKNIRNEKCATKQQVPTFPFVLDLKASDNNVHCSRAALTALKLAFERPAARSLHNLNKPSCAQPTVIPTIKLEVAVVGSTHDWFSDVLLSVLQKSREVGLHIDLSSLRFEDVSPDTTARIIRSLPNPSEVRELHFRHVDPPCLLQARDALCVLTGVEEFALATCDHQAASYNSTDTFILWNNIFASWPKLRALEFFGIRMCFHLADGSISGLQTTDKQCIRIPSSLRCVMFSDDSLTIDVLQWLTAYYSEIDSTVDNHHVKGRGCLRNLRFERETVLSCQQRIRELFLKLLITGRRCIEDVSIDHCGFTDAQSGNLTEVLATKMTSLRRLVILEPRLSWKTTTSILRTAVSSELGNTIPKRNLIYFSCLVPRLNDATVDPVLRTIQGELPTTSNPRCVFQESLTQLASKLGRPDIKIELFWEPECDWNWR